MDRAERDSMYGLDVPHGPSEVLFTKPTTPGAFTPAVIENYKAYFKAKNVYRDEHLEEYGEVVQYAIPTSSRRAPFIRCGEPFRRTRRKVGSPSFETFFNENLERWYG